MGCRDNFIVNGTMSWFCCGPAWGRCDAAGGGACGSCRSGYRHCAWPNASAACFDITRPDRCNKSIPRHGCGHALYVTNLCSNKCTKVVIKDCGPRTQSFCGQNCCGDKCRRSRIIDLTPAAFSAIANLDAGVRPCRVDN